VAVELVSGWVDNDRVYVVERSGDDTRVRALKSNWSAFFQDIDEDDRRSLQRLREVVGLKQSGRYTRIDFRSRWARKDICWQIREGARKAGELDPKILEGDVNPLRRLMSDHLELSVSPTPRLAWFDLETDSRKTFNDARDGKSRILSWAAVDHLGRERVEGLEQDTDAAERALIESFLVFVRDSDVLLAWNGSGFDFPVLAGRAAKLRAMPQGRHPLWHRWCWLDQLEVYRKYNQHAHESGDEKSSFKLDDVAHNLLGEGKDPFDARRTWEAWSAGGEERARLLRYNLKDAKLLPLIEAKSGYVALHLAVCHITRCFPDTLSLMASQQGDGFLISLGAQHGFRWPTKADREFEAQYEGAFVMEPTRLGIVEDVHVADFKSLYPSIMRSWNMSPDTLVPLDDPDPPGGSCRLPTFRASRFRREGRGMVPLALDQLVAMRGEYTARKDAAEPGSPDWEHFGRLSQAFKIVSNSFYGIVGSAFTRFFCREVAEGVTQTGAWLIKRVAARARELGLDPFYGDTDSVFVAGDRQTFAGVVDEVNASWGAILSEHGCPESHIELDFEKSFRRLVIVSKKRYAAAYSVHKGKTVGLDMKPEVKGLEYKRGDSVKIAREMQRELIGKLLAPAVPELEEIRAFVQQWQERVLNGPLSLDEIVLSQAVKSLEEYEERYTARLCAGSGAVDAAAKLGRNAGIGEAFVHRPPSKKGRKGTRCGYDFGGVSSETLEKCPRCKEPRKIASQPAHVRVARVLAERGEEIRQGTRVEYLIVKSASERLEAVPARDPGVLEQIDRSYYWDSRVYPPCSRVLQAVFPKEVWVETPAERRRRNAVAMRKTGVDDLPLFEAMRAE
jgi:DNA polymerase elongation subunit (family B)